MPAPIVASMTRSATCNSGLRRASTCDRLSYDALHSSGWFSGIIFDVMLPVSDDCPSLGPQCRRNQFVPRSVFFDFGSPKGTVRFWAYTVPRTSMKKASVTEYGHSGFRESDIWASGHPVVWPVPQTHRPKRPAQHHFGFGVFAPYPRHAVTSLPRCQHIHRPAPCCAWSGRIRPGSLARVTLGGARNDKDSRHLLRRWWQ